MTKPTEIAIREYHAILTQSGTANPTQRILHNTFKNEVIWERTGIGDYLGTLTGEFTAGKTGVQVNNAYQDKLTTGGDLEDGNSIFISQWNTSSNARADGLYECYVIIRTYK